MIPLKIKEKSKNRKVAQRYLRNLEVSKISDQETNFYN